MKKIFISIIAVLAGCGLALAQNFKLETKDGKVINDGDVLTVSGVVDFETHYDVALGLVFTNTSATETVYIESIFDVTGLATGASVQFCARQCYMDLTKIPILDIAPNGMLGKDEDVHIAYLPNEAFDTVVVGCTFTDTTAQKSLAFTVKFIPQKNVRPGVANENRELAGVSVYPNPSNGVFNLDVPERAQVEIFAVNGQMIRKMEVMAGKTSVEINRAGVYFMRVRANGKTAVRRIVIG